MAHLRELINFLPVQMLNLLIVLATLPVVLTSDFIESWGNCALVYSAIFMAALFLEVLLKIGIHINNHFKDWKMDRESRWEILNLRKAEKINDSEYTGLKIMSTDARCSWLENRRGDYV